MSLGGVHDVESASEHSKFSEVAAVAQSVEQRIRNAKVTSSIPVSGTISGKKGSQSAAFFAFHVNLYAYPRLALSRALNGINEVFHSSATTSSKPFSGTIPIRTPSFAMNGMRSNIRKAHFG